MRKEDILLVLACTFAFLLVYSPHFMYNYPFHIDEWHHIELALKLNEGKKIELMEIGFDFILSMLSRTVNLIKVYAFLPALFALFSAFILFYYLRKRFNSIAAFIGILLFASLPSNVNLLGLWFFTPLTMAIPFIYLSLFIFEEALNEKNKKKFIISLILTAIAFTIHPPSGLIIILGGGFLALREKKLFKEKKDLAYLLVLLIPITAYFIILWKGSFISTIAFLSRYLIFTKEFSVYLFSMNPIILYGIIPFILALVGMVKSFKIKKLQEFSFIFILSVINFIIFSIFDVTFFAHYQRVIYYAMLSAVPLSAIGFIYVYASIKKLIKNNAFKTILLITLIIIAILPPYINYYKLHQQARLYTLVNPEEVPALEFVRTLPEPIIITPRRIGNVLYPFTQKEALISLYWHKHKKEKEIEVFYKEDCDYEEDLLREIPADYVFSFDKINCSFLMPIFEDESFVYSVNLSNQNT